jgi:putative ABC transport system permease protein
MRIIDALDIVWSTFVNNKMRTILTVCGVAIGLGTIILLVSAGFGLQKLTVEKISSSQALLTITLSEGESKIIKINEEKVREVSALPEIDYVGSGYSFSGHASMPQSQTDTAVYIVDKSYLELDNLRLVAGNTLENDKTEVLISKAGVAALGFDDPSGVLGKDIELITYFSSDNLANNAKNTFKIKGVINEDTANMAYALKESIKIPEGTDYSQLKAKLKSAELIGNARAKIANLGLRVYSVAETINSMNKIFRVIQYILSGFGLIALIVASLGMFNTLTISLLERTREIGIMKALGATSGAIYLLFLTEALSMGAMGGALGSIFSIMISTSVNTLIGELSQRLGGERVYLFYTPWYFLLIVIAFSVVVGFLTGFYPARRASKLNALDSLRYE